MQKTRRNDADEDDFPADGTLTVAPVHVYDAAFFCARQRVAGHGIGEANKFDNSSEKNEPGNQDRTGSR